ncbi:MAG: MaoC family dehydratase [Rhodothermales bacterium]|nr:MaoC family dehydratase [Rhodothermales bacterium]MBO6778857.1 MaoC family dehydratase [Rhodothermales bacterium]
MNPNTYDALEVGQSYSVDRLITAEDVRTFADLTGDDNPIHIDEEFAAGTRFGKTVVHGVLLLGIISKVLGRDFPGPGCIAVSISSKFLRPVPVGSTITVEVRVAEKLEKYRHIKMKVYVYLAKKMALAGEAVLIPPPPAGD